MVEASTPKTWALMSVCWRSLASPGLTTPPPAGVHEGDHGLHTGSLPDKEKLVQGAHVSARRLERRIQAPESVSPFQLKASAIL